MPISDENFLLSPRSKINVIGDEIIHQQKGELSIYHNRHGGFRFVIEKEIDGKKEIIAALRVVDNKKLSPQITDLYVARAFSRQGLATELFKSALNEFKNLEHSPNLSSEGRAWKEKVDHKIKKIPQAKPELGVAFEITGEIKAYRIMPIENGTAKSQIPGQSQSINSKYFSDPENGIYFGTSKNFVKDYYLNEDGDNALFSCLIARNKIITPLSQLFSNEAELKATSAKVIQTEIIDGESGKTLQTISHKREKARDGI